MSQETRVRRGGSTMTTNYALSREACWGEGEYPTDGMHDTDVMHPSLMGTLLVDRYANRRSPARYLVLYAYILCHIPSTCTVL